MNLLLANAKWTKALGWTIVASLALQFVVHPALTIALPLLGEATPAPLSPVGLFEMLTQIGAAFGVAWVESRQDGASASAGQDV